MATMITTKMITTTEYVTSSLREGHRTLRISETLSRTNRVGRPPRPPDGRDVGASERVAVTSSPLEASGRTQGRQDSNLQPPVLETGALPIEPRPCEPPRSCLREPLHKAERHADARPPWTPARQSTGQGPVAPSQPKHAQAQQMQCLASGTMDAWEAAYLTASPPSPSPQRSPSMPRRRRSRPRDAR